MSAPVNFGTTDEGDPWDENAYVVFDKDDPKRMIQALPQFWCMWAETGDRVAIVELAGMCATLLRQIRQDSGVRFQDAVMLDWMASVFEGLGAGQSPDEAMLWKIPGKRGPRKTMQGFFERFRVAMDVAIAKRERPGESIEEIIAAIAEKQGTPEPTLWRWYKEFNRERWEWSNQTAQGDNQN